MIKLVLLVAAIAIFGIGFMTVILIICNMILF
ncbi:hypothetical protein [Spiroplasma kunkelii]